MNWYTSWISLGILCFYCLQTTQQCSPPKGWRPMQPHERAQKAKIVVFGTVVSSPQSKPKSDVEGRFYTVLLQVHCVVKGPKLPLFINVSGFSDFLGGLCVHSRAFLNKSYVVFVENDVDNPGGFRVLEVNIQKGAVHAGHRFSVLRDVMFVVGQNASLPIGAAAKSNSETGCPDFANQRRIFRDPAPNKRKQSKACRCRRKKQNRKKKKRVRGTLLPRNKVRMENVTSGPTIPRTRRYNVLNLEQDKVEKEHQGPHTVKTVSFSNAASHQSITWWRFLLLTFQTLVVVMLLPT